MPKALCAGDRPICSVRCRRYRAGASAGHGFRFFCLASGVAMLIANILACLLWDSLGAAVTFYAGALFSLAAVIVLVLGTRRAA